MPVDLAIANALLQSGVDSGIYTHAVCALAVAGDTVDAQAFGQASPDTVFDLASLTKPIATATLLLQLVERGDLHLLRTVAPFFVTVDAAGDLAELDLRYLATHTSGLPPIPDWPDSADGWSPADLIQRVIRTARLSPPGARYAYSDTGYILLAEVLSQTAGKPLADLFRSQIAERAGMENTIFLPPDSWKPRIAPTSARLAPGIVHDPRARDLGGVAGHAGLFGTAADVLTYLEIIRKGGAPLLSRASVARMSVSQIETSVGGHSIGWFCGGNDYLPSGDLFSDRSFGHSGFTGTMALVDPEYDVSLVLLTNRVINETEDGARYLDLRRRWTNAVAAAIGRS